MKIENAKILVDLLCDLESTVPDFYFGDLPGLGPLISIEERLNGSFHSDIVKEEFKKIYEEIATIFEAEKSRVLNLLQKKIEEI